MRAIRPRWMPSCTMMSSHRHWSPRTPCSSMPSTSGHTGASSSRCWQR